MWENATVSNPTGKPSRIGRRGVLKAAGATAVVSALSVPAVASLMVPETRTLSLVHLHTGERLDATYWAEGAYVAEELAAIDVVLRDFRSGEVKPIDRRLLDLLHQVRRAMRSTAPFEVVSGYRSPETNAALRRTSRGVAKNSYHMRGMAIDVRLPGRGLAQLRHAALRRRAGGVGYYSGSGFIHLDVGPPRRW